MRKDWWAHLNRVFSAWSYNHFHNILRLFDSLPNLPFTTSETMRDYYLKACNIRVASRVDERLRT